MSNELTVKQVRDTLDAVISAARKTNRYTLWNIEFRLSDSGVYVEFMGDAYHFCARCEREAASK